MGISLFCYKSIFNDIPNILIWRIDRTKLLFKKIKQILIFMITVILMLAITVGTIYASAGRYNKQSMIKSVEPTTVVSTTQTTTETTTRETTTETTSQKEATTKKKETTTKKTQTLLDCKFDNFKTEGKISTSDKNDLIRGLNKLPDKLIDRFNLEGWTICLTTTKIEGNYYHGSVKGSIAGLTVYADKIIYISVQASYPTTTVIAYHELGHFTDWYNDYASKTEEFIAIYNEEKDNLTKINGSKRQLNHAKSDPQEYYAACFSEIRQGKDLKKECPHTYEFIENNFNNL